MPFCRQNVLTAATIWSGGSVVPEPTGTGMERGRVTLESLAVAKIKKGDKWALNICRSLPGRQMWTFVWSPKGFHTPEDFGTLTFE